MDSKSFDEIFKEFEKGFALLGEAIGESMEAITSSLQSIANIYTPIAVEIQDTFDEIIFQRGDGETFLEWSERLNQSGYLDSPYYRWEYQKATFRWVASPIVYIWNKLNI